MRSCRARGMRAVLAWTIVIVLALGRLCHASGGEFGSHVPAIAEQIAKSGKQRIAVVDFTDLQGNVTELGRFLAEELSVSLAAAAHGFDVIDRTHLENLLAEHRLSSRGLIDPQTTLKLKVAGVQGLLTGTVIPLGDDVRLTLKVLDVETAKISAPTEVDIPKTPAIQALIERGVDREPEGGPPAAAPRGPSRQRQVVNKIAFDLKSCRSVGGRAVCQFSVTSTESDYSITVASMRVLDEDGIEHGGGDVKLGGSVRSWANLVADVPMSMSLIFDVPQTAKRWALIEFEFTHEFERPRKVQFRNIQLVN
jgi:hypothetical protein